MIEILAVALTRACDYDYQHRPHDGRGWTRVYDDQIRRLLEGLAAQGYPIVNADRLTDGIPKDAPLWPDDEELAEGHFTDRTYAWWKGALGHPRAHTGCCATCGCAASCFLDVFYDAVVASVARHAIPAQDTAP